MSVHPKHWWRTVNPLFAGDACRDPSPFAVTPRSNPGTSLRPAFDTASGFHGTPILERLLWVLKKYSFLDTSEFTSPGYFSQQKKPFRDMYFVSQRWLSSHTFFFSSDEHSFYGKSARHHYNTPCDYPATHLWPSKSIAVGLVLGFRSNALLRTSWHSSEIWFGNVKCGLFSIAILYNAAIDSNSAHGGLVVSISTIVHPTLLEEWKIHTTLLDIQLHISPSYLIIFSWKITLRLHKSYLSWFLYDCWMLIVSYPNSWEKRKSYKCLTI